MSTRSAITDQVWFNQPGRVALALGVVGFMEFEDATFADRRCSYLLQVKPNAIVDIEKEIAEHVLERQRVPQLVPQCRTVPIKPGLANLKPGPRVEIERKVRTKIFHALLREEMFVGGILQGPVRFSVRDDDP